MSDSVNAAVSFKQTFTHLCLTIVWHESDLRETLNDWMIIDERADGSDESSGESSSSTMSTSTTELVPSNSETGSWLLISIGKHCCVACNIDMIWERNLFGGILHQGNGCSFLQPEKCKTPKNFTLQIYIIFSMVYRLFVRICYILTPSQIYICIYIYRV